MDSSGPSQGLPTAPGDAASLLDSLSKALKTVSLPPNRRLLLDEIVSQLRCIYAPPRPVVHTIESSTPNNPTDHPITPQNASSSTSNTCTATSSTSPSSPTVVPDSQGGGYDSMGGVERSVAAMQALSTPPNDPQQQLLQHSNDLPPLTGLEASSSSSTLSEGPWTLVQKLTKSIEVIATRLERLEHKNPYDHLPSDVEGPPRPSPSPYAAAASRPAPPNPPQPLPRSPAPHPAAPIKETTEVVIIRTGFLPSDHALRAVEPSRLLHRVRDDVSKLFSHLPPSLLRATRLERGDVQVVAKTSAAAALLRRALPLVWPSLETVDPPERVTVFLHKIGVEVEGKEVEAAVVKACGEEGAVKRLVGLPVREGARWRSAVVELWNAGHVSRLLSSRFLFIRPGVVADVEKARSRLEQRQWREERAKAMRTRAEAKEEEEKKEKPAEEEEKEVTHPHSPSPAVPPTHSTPPHTPHATSNPTNPPSRLPGPSNFSSPGLPPIPCPSFTNTVADACASGKDASDSVEVTRTVVHEEEEEERTRIMILVTSPGPSPPHSEAGDDAGVEDWSIDASVAAGEEPPVTPFKLDPGRRALQSERILKEEREKRAAEKASFPAGREGPLALMSVSMSSSVAAEEVRRMGERATEESEEEEEVEREEGKKAGLMAETADMVAWVGALQKGGKKALVRRTGKMGYGGKGGKVVDVDSSSEDELTMIPKRK